MGKNQTGEIPTEPSEERDVSEMLPGITEEEDQKPEKIHFNPASLTEEEAYWADMWYEDDEGRKHRVYWGSGEDFACPDGWLSVMATRKKIEGVSADFFVKCGA